MSDLAAACADLAAWLPAAAALLPEPDTDGTSGGGRPGSSPPWNPAAAAALLDAHAGIRDLEQDLRYRVTGTLAVRGGSDANTLAALAAVSSLGSAVTREHAARAAHLLDGLITQILQLAAVDLEERPQRVRAACPYCHAPMLRVLPRSGVVTCLRWGACLDSDGQHPRGEIGRSQMDGSPLIAWRDGLVT